MAKLQYINKQNRLNDALYKKSYNMTGMLTMYVYFNNEAYRLNQKDYFLSNRKSKPKYLFTKEEEEQIEQFTSYFKK